MAARKRSGTRRKTTRARTRTRKSTTRRNPTLSLTRRRSRRGSVAARSRRRTTRRSNPSGKLLPLVIGGGVSALVAGFLPSLGAGPLMQAAKLVAVGWGLEKFLGRTVPSVFGEARDGAIITAGGMLFQSFVAPQLSGVLNSVMPKSANGNGVSGLAVTPYPLSPGMPPLMNPVQAAPSGVRGMATAQRFR